MSCKISIITPIYNSEKTIIRAFQSVKAQTIGFENIEWIAVDDCSTDGSFEVLKRLASEYENVTAFRRDKNSGFAGAPRNDGIRLSKAPYIMFLDSDDCLTEDACEILCNAVEQSGADIVAGCYSVDNLEDSSKSLSIMDSFEHMREGEYDLSEDMGSFVPICDINWNKLWRATIIKDNNIRFPENLWGEDGVFQAEYLCHCDKGYYLKKRVYRYLVHSDSASQEPTYRYMSTVGGWYPVMYDLLVKYNRTCYMDAYLNHYMPVDYNFEKLINCETEFSDGELREIFKGFGFLSDYIEKHKLCRHSPAARILTRDIVKGDIDTAVFDFRGLREYAKQRKQELNNIFSSRTWRLSKGIARLFGRG